MSSQLAAFHLLVRIAPNPVAGEAVAVGLVFFDGQRYRFRFSPRKQRLAAELAPASRRIVYQLIQQVAQRLEGDTEARLRGVKANSPELIQLADWQYMNRYSNGLLQISNPNPVALFENDAPGTVFEQLYGRLVEKSRVVSAPSLDVFTSPAPVRALVERVKGSVHTELHLTDQLLSGLFFELDLTCLGLNGSFTAAHTLPLERFTMPTLQQHIFEYETAAQILTRTYEKSLEKSAFYVICDEPSQSKDPAKHKLWQVLKSHPVLKTLPTSQAEEVAERIEKTKAHRFLRPIRRGSRVRALQGT
ncbi:DUF3037 domain-containing protein [Hymenobacter sp. BT523]|uniref:DUF3037 domain-containing protein n=1 Tax=Hymenobacter sp. BT523 TaxID=2795725 RepID=UPI0018ED59A7|nr:DUF3037 domain-containing protein [Hymenobacter sp. BT523]MBJ6111794.1 DUF3037 domain-containing protein [Hymenobacter sp. BT523]